MLPNTFDCFRLIKIFSFLGIFYLNFFFNLPQRRDPAKTRLFGKTSPAPKLNQMPTVWFLVIFKFIPSLNWLDFRPGVHWQKNFNTMRFL